MTGCPGSVTETVYVKGVVVVEVWPRSASNKRRRAPLEGGVEVVALGIGTRIFTWPDEESNLVEPPPFGAVMVIWDADDILGASR